MLYDPPLGSGSYATAYLVSCDNFTYVLKKMNTSRFSDEIKKKLLSEMVILRKLKPHPNVIQYKDSWLDKSYYYLVMNYCRNGDLLDVISSHQKARTKIPQSDIIKYGLDIANGIEFIHNSGIVHRDLKPGNIFLDMGNCVIGDFGVAKMITNTVSVSTMIGTPSYMAPEMFDGNPYDASVDIWAFGCILLELCTLDIPFSGCSMSDVINAIRLCKIPKIDEYPQLEKILRGIIVKEPKCRLSISEIITEFKKL